MHQQTKELLRKHNVRLTKSLGQNFLIDGNIIKRIADSAGLSEKDTVIEVGAGIGNLTVELAKRAKLVIAVEIDRHLVPAFSENTAGLGNIKLINEDVLKVDFFSILDKLDIELGQITVAGNLPYYITTPVIMSFLEKGPEIKSMCVMVQKEVADRITAPPGNKDYGALTVVVRYFAKAQKLFNVPPHCFIPQPGVDSTVIRMEVNKKPPVELLNKDCFFKVIRSAFGQRRKTLVNALYNSRNFNLTKEQFCELLKDLGVNENERGENLDINQFAKLSNSIFLLDR